MRIKISTGNFQLPMPTRFAFTFRKDLMVTSSGFVLSDSLSLSDVSDVSDVSVNVVDVVFFTGASGTSLELVSVVSGRSRSSELPSLSLKGYRVSWVLPLWVYPYDFGFDIHRLYGYHA
ncbi:MAG TPA: hypothetical protein EYN81_03965, partial [Candidatus Marinimicrobia bacterium]|nr:hypothetical protein [Candidatus Neomarinimicrobiota bacterium]